MLSDRRQLVLRALIEEYVASALPVGSKTITEHYGLGVSSATIRSELSALEEFGYIAQPHTSAGRVPTQFGYRAFVDALLADEAFSENAAYEPHFAELRQNAFELDSLLEQVSSSLMRFTDCLSLVLAPSVLRLRAKQISLVSLDATHALIVVVTEDGQVLNRRIEFDNYVQPEELAEVQLFLTEAFCGVAIDEVRAHLESGVVCPTQTAYTVMKELLACLKECNVVHAKHLGLSALLNKPEFSASSSLLPVLRVLEDDEILLEILDDVITDESDPTVRIGSENKATGLNGVSVVASRYGHGDSSGVIAVIGPTRMDYSRIIAAVRSAGLALQDLA